MQLRVRLMNDARGSDEKKRVQAITMLKFLREKGVLLVGAGTLSHNLRLVHFGGKEDKPDAWAEDYDAWVTDKLDKGDVASLQRTMTLAPSAKLAAPTPEHLDPFFFVLGAAEGNFSSRFCSRG